VAFSVAARRTEKIVRYANVARLASAVQDELLTAFLSALYLEPLGEDRGDGEVLRETLRAYFTADGNVTSTAAALGVSRNTFTNRLRTIETKIGHLRPSRASDLALALELETVLSAKCPMDPTIT
jgi:DNA-binding PucR family transcriptional regulator